MGSGGGWSAPSKTLKELLELENQKKQKENDRAINDLLQSLLKELNNRNSEQVQSHLKTLKGAIEKEIDGNVDLLFGGSVSKHTYTKGLSDIDMLVRLNNTHLINAKPKEVLEYFANQIQSRLPNTSVKQGELAVTVKFSSGHEIQLLPSVKTSTGYKIAKPGKNEWSNVIKPKKFAEKLTKVNQSNGGKVIPVIKLYKMINSQLPKQSRLSGYHIESLAIEAFKNTRTYPKNIKDALKTFCEKSQSRVLSPIKDNTGQSLHVDDYLGGRDSVRRQRVSHDFKMLHKKISNANSVSDWKDIIN
ncbi:CBASS oligonucleotide cyclase [Lysinibacillus xylanilyticus]|uniref:CBASS oligonucleotide cyclase n=1 Tax=Lysinibacillus xylanilyticus TaxID=582475 RepID=UPI0037FF6D52